MKKMSILILALLTLFACGMLAGCGEDEDKDKCQPGAEGCECIDNQHCNIGLSCQEGVCIPGGQDGGDAAVTTADTGSTVAVATDTAAVTPTLTHSEIAMENMGDGRMCASGTVVGPETDDGWSDHWGAGFGFDLCKPDKDTSDKIPLEECHVDLSTLAGFRITLSGTLPTELRIQFEDNEDDTDYTHIVAGSLDATDYLFADATVTYQEDSPPLVPGHVTSVQIQIASAMNGYEEFDFCVEKVEIIADESLANAGGDAGMTDADGGVDGGAAAVDAGTTTPPAETASDTITEDGTICTPDAATIIADGNGWIDGCTNFLGIQGYWFHYSDGGNK